MAAAKQQHAAIRLWTPWIWGILDFRSIRVQVSDEKIIDSDTADIFWLSAVSNHYTLTFLEQL